MNPFAQRVVPSRWSTLRWTAPSTLMAMMLCATSLGLFFFLSQSLGILAGLASLGLLATAALWIWPNIGLLVLTSGGALHSFLMLFVFSVTGPGIALKAAQSWKELIVVILLAKVVHVTLSNRQRVSVTLLDALIVLFLMLGAAYVFHPGVVEGEQLDLVTRIFGFRSDAFFLLAYFIGRGLPISQGTLKIVLVTFMGVSLVIAVIAPLQFVAPTAANVFFDSIGFNEYLNAQRGDDKTYYAIRHNQIPGMLIPRASSLLLSDLGLAFYMLAAVPVTGAFFIQFKRPLARLVNNILVLLNVAALVLTITRTAILASVPLLLVLFARWSGLALGMLVLVQLVVLGGAGAYLQGYSFETIRELFSAQDQSVQGHLHAITDSLEIMREHPLGRGFGTAGTVAQRLGASGGVTNESWYLQIGTEVGILGMLIWLAITFWAATTMFIRYSQSHSPWLRALCLGLGCSMIGYAFASLTLHAWESLAVSIIIWMLVGFAASAPAIEARWLQQANPSSDRRINRGGT